MGMRRQLAWGVVATAAAGAILAMLGCGAGSGYPIGAANAKPMVLIEAEHDLDCPQDEIRVEEQWGGRWLAVGCGRKARYFTNCDGIQCIVHNEETNTIVPIRDRPLDIPR